MTCLGSKLYIFGGLSKSRFSNKLYDLDISNFNLIPLEVDENNIPEGRAFHHAI